MRCAGEVPFSGTAYRIRELSDEAASAETAARLASGAGASSQLHSHDTSLFLGLVLGWIETDFCNQGLILQHFSRSTRKSSSREQISAKILQNFGKI